MPVQASTKRSSDDGDEPDGIRVVGAHCSNCKSIVSVGLGVGPGESRINCPICGVYLADQSQLEDVAATELAKAEIDAAIRFLGHQQVSKVLRLWVLGEHYSRRI